MARMRVRLIILCLLLNVVALAAGLIRHTSERLGVAGLAPVLVKGVRLRYRSVRERFAASMPDGDETSPEDPGEEADTGEDGA